MAHHEAALNRESSEMKHRVETALDGHAEVSLFVPGRVEVLGKHTDYCGGRSLICAVDRGIAMAARGRTDHLVRIRDLALDEQATIEFRADLTPEAGHWRNYPATVARRLARNFPGAARGAEIVIGSNLPPAAGLSSSSAMITGMAIVLACANGLMDRREWRENIRSGEDFASYLGTIENGRSFGQLAGDRGVGTFGGSQDHTAILLATENTISQYSFCPVRFEARIPMPRGQVLLVGSSGVAAEKTGAAMAKYNEVSLCATAILDLWNGATRRSDACLAEALDSGPAAADELGRIVQTARHPQFQSGRLRERLEQHIEESRTLIPKAAEALRRGDLGAFGQLVDRSQELAEKKLGNQVPETVFLARWAREIGCTAASAFGAGFGGAVWAMAEGSRADETLRAWERAYKTRFPQHAERARFFRTSAGPGVGEFLPRAFW